MTTSCSDSGWLHVLLSRTEMTELSLGISAAGSCASAARAKGRRPALLHTPGGRGQVACRASPSLVGGGRAPTLPGESQGQPCPGAGPHHCWLHGGVEDGRGRPCPAHMAGEEVAPGSQCWFPRLCRVWDKVPE